MRPWLKQQGMSWFPVVGWAERGGYGGFGHGNSVPRFHITWGSGPGVLAPFLRASPRRPEAAGRLRFRFRHRVDGLIVTNGTARGVRGAVLEPSSLERGVKSSRKEIGEFELRGAGGHPRLRRHRRRLRAGAPALARAARHATSNSWCRACPTTSTAAMLTIAEAAGARLINRDRMWHYTEGLRNWNPIWTNHGIRILPGPSSLWLDATGKRLPPPLFPGFDNLGTLEYIMKTGYEYSWFVLNQQIIKKEFALSGSEQNPDFTNKDWRPIIAAARAKRATPPVEAFKEHGADFVVADHLDELVKRMNEKTGQDLLDRAAVEREINARDAQLDNPFGKDLQLAAIRQARNYLGDKLIRTTPLHRILDPEAGPLIAVKLNILTRKTLGGFETDLSGRVLRFRRSNLPRVVCSRRSLRVRRRRRARISSARRDFPRRLHLLGPRSRPVSSPRAGLTSLARFQDPPGWHWLCQCRANGRRRSLARPEIAIGHLTAGEQRHDHLRHDVKHGVAHHRGNQSLPPIQPSPLPSDCFQPPDGF